MDKPAVKYLSNIVVTGAFNPSIIQPAWLISTGIVSPPSDDEEVSIKMPVVSPSLIFRFEIGEAKWTVATDRLILEPKKDKSVQALAISVLKKLPHTPLAAVGTNVESVISQEVWQSNQSVISKNLVDACSQIGTINEKNCILRIDRGDDVILTVNIMEVLEKVIFNMNFHQITHDLNSAQHALSKYNQHINDAKKIVNDLCGAMVQS